MIMSPYKFCKNSSNDILIARIKLLKLQYKRNSKYGDNFSVTANNNYHHTDGKKDKPKVTRFPTRDNVKETLKEEAYKSEHINLFYFGEKHGTG